MSSIIHQHCPGNNNGPSLLSSGNEAFIRYQVFDTDLDVHFEIHITSTICNLTVIQKLNLVFVSSLIYFEIAACGQMELSVTNETQILTSPNYPLPYGNNLICTWSLELKRSNRVIMLRFIDLDLENTKDCLSDYLEIRYSPVNN